MRKNRIHIFLIIFAIFWTVPMLVVIPNAGDMFAQSGMVAIVAILFAVAVPAVLWGIAIAQFVRTRKLKRVAKEGETFTATFVTFRTNTSVNGVKQYRLHYTWKDALGNVHEGKTKDVYNLDEAYLFKAAKTFRIKVMGELSVVIDEPSMLVFEQSVNEPAKKEFYSCQYCGAAYAEDDDKCPHCGATRKE